MSHKHRARPGIRAATTPHGGCPAAAPRQQWRLSSRGGTASGNPRGHGARDGVTWPWPPLVTWSWENDDERRSGEVAVRVRDDQSFLLRPDHDRFGVPDRAAADGVVPERQG